jgi:beta-1,4-mannosyltransferase
VPPELVVLESSGPPNERTNPYLPLLEASLPPAVRARWFSWRRALLEPFDVFHLHWPEVKLRGRTRVRTWARWALFLLLLARIRFQRKALVRTLHNLEPHEQLPRVPRALMRLCDRWTTWWIVHSDLLVPPSPGPVTVIPHGHYRSWFADQPRVEPVRGRLLHMGLLRRYKGVDALLDAFARLPDPHLSLRIVGATVDPEVGARVRAASAQDARVTAVEDYVEDDVLVREITASELVVLPFATVTSSGSLLLALSLDRPVLVARGPITEQLAAEVGDGWVLTYEGPLGPETLERGLESSRRHKAANRPDLDGREWDQVGAAHADTFAAAVRAARRSPLRATHP